MHAHLELVHRPNWIGNPARGFEKHSWKTGWSPGGVTFCAATLPKPSLHPGRVHIIFLRFSVRGDEALQAELWGGADHRNTKFLTPLSDLSSKKSSFMTLAGNNLNSNG